MIPCQGDERDWTAETIHRSDAAEMTALCGGCPFRRPCHQRALDNLPNTHGVWGGVLYQDGRPINPRDDAPRRRSLYRGVVWDLSRECWKAFGQIPKTETTARQHFHLGYFVNEKRAALAARAWRIRHDQAA